MLPAPLLFVSESHVCKFVSQVAAGLLPEGPNTDALEEAVSLTQHHDASTGTAKQHVADDYNMRIAAGDLKLDFPYVLDPANWLKQWRSTTMPSPAAQRSTWPTTTTCVWLQVNEQSVLNHAKSCGEAGSFW